MLISPQEGNGHLTVKCTFSVCFCLELHTVTACKPAPNSEYVHTSEMRLITCEYGIMCILHTLSKCMYILCSVCGEVRIRDQKCVLLSTIIPVTVCNMSYSKFFACTVLFRASAHRRSQLKHQKLRVGGYTEEVL